MNSCYVLTIGLNDEAPKSQGIPSYSAETMRSDKNVWARCLFEVGGGSHSESQTREASFILALSLKCDSTAI